MIYVHANARIMDKISSDVDYEESNGQRQFFILVNLTNLTRFRKTIRNLQFVFFFAF